MKSWLMCLNPGNWAPIIAKSVGIGLMLLFYFLDQHIIPEMDSSARLVMHKMEAGIRAKDAAHRNLTKLRDLEYYEHTLDLLSPAWRESGPIAEMMRLDRERLHDSMVSMLDLSIVEFSEAGHLPPNTLRAWNVLDRETMEKRDYKQAWEKMKQATILISDKMNQNVNKHDARISALRLFAPLCFIFGNLILLFRRDEHPHGL